MTVTWLRQAKDAVRPNTYCQSRRLHATPLPSFAPGSALLQLAANARLSAPSYNVSLPYNTSLNNVLNIARLTLVVDLFIGGGSKFI